MISTNNINEARKQITKLVGEGKEVIVQAASDDFNRKVFENKNVDVIVGLEFEKKDYLKQRDSGLNEVLCKLAKKYDIKIGIDLNRLIRLGKLEKARVLSRIRQNIGLCKRVGCKIIVNGNVGKSEVLSFFLSLKGSTKQGNQAYIKL